MNDPRLATLLPYFLPLLVVIIVVRRALREPRARVRSLGMIPAIFAVLTVWALILAPPPSMIWAAGLLAAGVAGAGLGWLMGAKAEPTLDARPGYLAGRATPVAALLFAFIFLARTSLRMALVTNPIAAATSDPRIPLMADVFLLFALGMLAAQRWVLWKKTKALASPSTE